MISTFLAEHPWITTVALVASVALGPIVGYWLVGRPRLNRWLAIAALAPVAVLTLAPTSRSLTVGCAVEWAFPTWGAVELMANLVLFVPVALLFGVLTGRPLRALVGASLASGLIELFQAVVPALGRSCSTNDWLSNTLGSILGAALAALALAVSRRRAEVETQAPTVGTGAGHSRG